MSKILTYALMGSIVGLVLAQLFPSLGQHGFGRGVNDLAIALGGQKPFASYAAIGAIVGAILGAVSAKK